MTKSTKELQTSSKGFWSYSGCAKAPEIAPNSKACCLTHQKVLPELGNGGYVVSSLHALQLTPEKPGTCSKRTQECQWVQVHPAVLQCQGCTEPQIYTG